MPYDFERAMVEYLESFGSKDDGSGEDNSGRAKRDDYDDGGVR